MKWKYILFISAGLLAGLLLSSCKRSLDLYPLDTLSEAQFFNTENDFELFTNQFYNIVPTYNGDDESSDIAMPISGFNQVSNSSYAAPTGDGNWDGYYSVIWQTSYLLEKIAAAPAELKPQIAKYEAETRFFRALAYFMLVKKFGDVPLVEKRLDVSDKDILYGPRNARAEVISFVLSELDLAVAGLPLESDIATADKGRVSKGAALALEARVALFEGSWRKFHATGDDPKVLFQKAIDACNAVFASNQYQLFDRRDVMGDSSYRFFFILDKIDCNPAGLTKADQHEVILARRYDRDIAGSPGVTTGPSATRKMADMFLCKDGKPITKSGLFQGYNTVNSEFVNRDPRMTNDLLVPLQRYWSFAQPSYYRDWTNPSAGGLLYNVEFGVFTQTGYAMHKFSQELMAPFSTDYPAIRLAELYLIYAEARFEMDGAISDADLGLSINKLRTRVGMPGLTNAFVINNGLDMRTEIRRERTVELFGEGFRFDDLRRWKTAETELSQSLRGIKYKGTQFATDPRWSSLVFNTDAEGFIILEDASKRKFPQKNYLYPLPLRQVIINPDLVQNAGW
jgi:hypothetical protein